MDHRAALIIKPVAWGEGGCVSVSFLAMSLTAGPRSAGRTETRCHHQHAAQVRECRDPKSWVRSFPERKWGLVRNAKLRGRSLPLGGSTALIRGECGQGRGTRGRGPSQRLGQPPPARRTGRYRARRTAAGGFCLAALPPPRNDKLRFNKHSHVGPLLISS